MWFVLASELGRPTRVRLPVSQRGSLLFSHVKVLHMLHT